MKKFSLIAVLCALVSFTYAQLPDGSYGQNFHLFEIDKATGDIITTDTITLYEYTDAGKAVFMDVFATWCSPCWNYHNTGALESLYNTYGPEGSNQVQVLFIEGSNGNYASLSGTGPDASGSATAGNWLAGTPYPVIPLKMGANASQYSSFHSNYAIAYFPTVYMVCPNRLVYEVGQISSGAGLFNCVASKCPAYDNTLMNNALIVEGSGINGIYFCSASFTPSITLQNVGDLDLTSATITITCNGQTSTYDWTGNLSKYNVANITLPQVNITAGGNYTYTATVTTVNGVADADPAMNSFSFDFSVQSHGTTAQINEDFSDCIPNTWGEDSDLLGCYSVSGGTHGKAIYFDCYSYQSGTTDELYVPMVDLTGINNPVLKFDLAHKRYSSASDRLKVQYSNNCGSSWTTAYNKAGADLATAGTSSNQYVPSADSQWRTETVDLSGISSSNDGIVKFVFQSGYGNVIWIDNVRIVDGTGVEEFDGTISIYPNPANNVLNISSSESVEQVVIYNVAGQVVMTENGNVQSMNISNLASGSYIVRIQTVDGNISNQRFIKE